MPLYVGGSLINDGFVIYIPVAVFAFRTDNAELQKRVMSHPMGGGFRTASRIN